MEWFLILLISAAIVGVALYVGQRRQGQLESEGKIVKRTGDWWRLESHFSTSASYEAIRDALDVNALAADGIAVTKDFSNSRTIVFQSTKKVGLNPEGWSAALLSRGVQNGRNQFEYSVYHWKTHNGSTLGTTTMNIALTALERAFLFVDPQTTVTTRRMQVKSKTRLF